MTEYFNRIHGGLPIDDIEIIDFHAHLGPYFNMHIPESDAGAMIRMMDLCGIDKTIISSTPGICSDLVYGNNMMLEAVSEYRGRLYGACMVNGNYPELSLDELVRCFAEDSHVVIIKLHPVLTFSKMSDRRRKGIYEFASERKLFFVVHTWLDNDLYGNQDIFAGVAKDYPDIKWLMGHSGGPYGAYHAVEIAEELPNVFLDLTLSMIPARQLEFFVGEVGADRVMFGTDNPFIDPRPQIGRVCLAEISHEDRVKILGGNAKKYIDFN